MRRMATAALAMLLLPALVRGQEPVGSFDQLNTRLKIGDKVIVTDAHGREYEGKILEISPTALALATHGSERLNVSPDVQLVQQRQRDSLKNGALIGLACGLAIAGAGAADCAGGQCGLAPMQVFAILGGIFGGVGAAIGTGIDALIPGEKRVVYSAPEGKPGAHVMLSPIITSRTKALALSLAF